MTYTTVKSIFARVNLTQDATINVVKGALPPTITIAIYRVQQSPRCMVALNFLLPLRASYPYTSSQWHGFCRTFPLQRFVQFLESCVCVIKLMFVIALDILGNRIRYSCTCWTANSTALKNSQYSSRRIQQLGVGCQYNLLMLCDLATYHLRAPHPQFTTQFPVCINVLPENMVANLAFSSLNKKTTKIIILRNIL